MSLSVLSRIGSVSIPPSYFNFKASTASQVKLGVIAGRAEPMADRADRAARRRGKSAETTSPDDSDGSTSDEGEPSELPMCTTHEKVHLEVTDSQHRYAKHLRMYHREWESRGSVGSFWDWIDAEPLVTMPDCPRERLQECRVAYLHLPEERAPYIVEVHQGRFYHPENPGTGEERSPYSTGEGEWIFVFSSARVSAALSRLPEPEHFLHPLPYAPPRTPLRLLSPQVLFCHRKTRGAFHHTSFLAGGPCIAAGTLVISDGVLEELYPHSGHYRPGEHHLHQLLARQHSQTRLSTVPRLRLRLRLLRLLRARLAALGGSALPKGEAGPLGAQPRPRVFERAASQAADVTAVGPPGPLTLVRGQPRQRQRRCAASVQGAAQSVAK